MPVNKNALIRIKILDDCLKDDYHEYTIDDLVEKVSDKLIDLGITDRYVSRRLIEKDIKSLEDEPFAAPIEVKKTYRFSKDKLKNVTKNIYHYGRSDFSIFNVELNNDEKALLSDALNIFGQFDGIPNFEQLLRLSQMTDLKSKKIVSFNRNPKEDSHVFGKLYYAIANRVAVSLKYFKFEAPDDVKEVTVFPYQLREYNRRWFLICKHAETEKVLTFALDRIKDVNNESSIFCPPCRTNWDEYYADIIGMTLNDQPTLEILLWASDNHNCKSYILTKPIHKSQNIIDEDIQLRKKYQALAGGIFFTIRCKPNYELTRELCSYGGDLVVLSPDTVRDEVYKWAKNMEDRYKNIGQY